MQWWFELLRSKHSMTIASESFFFFLIGYFIVHRAMRILRTFLFSLSPWRWTTFFFHSFLFSYPTIRISWAVEIFFFSISFSSMYCLVYCSMKIILVKRTFPLEIFSNKTIEIWFTVNTTTTTTKCGNCLNYIFYETRENITIRPNLYR